MMYKIGDGIISPLGSTTEENFQAVKAGYSGIRQFPAGFRGLSHPILAALISPRDLENLAAPYAGARISLSFPTTGFKKTVSLPSASHFNPS